MIQCRVDRVAMESTGVYWIAVYELLQAAGLKPYLVNARQVKNVPGRKTAVLDCQGLHKLHRLGLLSASFRPDAERVTWRAYLRQRAELTGAAALRPAPAEGRGLVQCRCPAARAAQLAYAESPGADTCGALWPP